MKRYMYNPSRVKLLSKHMYPEEIFNDLNPDRAFTLWRFRNIKVENYKNSNSKEQSKQIISSQGSDMIANLLDCIFGDLESGKEISHSNNVSKRSRRGQRGHKRAHRHYHHHREANQM
ncbi:hypothetical protein IHE45_13G068400 [Dioscorea alata]|uniref:Uncharacterized protein n=1 Tax=Dioscorea alata TaxID=55571 RepID=A0ACB7UYX7_DIOAL|nr:hypothetical protein IHE45_13G068400 [Dioscorea alata]